MSCNCAARLAYKTKITDWLKGHRSQFLKSIGCYRHVLIKFCCFAYSKCNLVTISIMAYRWCKGLWCHFHLVWLVFWGFQPYMHLVSFRYGAVRAIICMDNHGFNTKLSCWGKKVCQQNNAYYHVWLTQMYGRQWGRKPCSCTQFTKSCIFYCKSCKNPYQYYKSHENSYQYSYQVLQVTRTTSEHAMKSKVHMIKSLSP